MALSDFIISEQQGEDILTALNTIATNTGAFGGKNEDDGHVSGDSGSAVLSVRQDTISGSTSTDGDYGFLKSNEDGALYVAIASGSSAGTEFNEDSAHTIGDAGTQMLAVREDSLSSSVDTIGDYGHLKINNVGRLYTATTIDAALPAGTNNIGDVDVDSLPGTVEADLTAVKTAVELLDNAVDGAYLNVNMNLAGSDAQAGEGTISATTQRVTIATDDDGVAHLATIAGAVSTQMQVDVVAISAQSDGTYIGDIKFGESLPAGSAAIGKLAANDGVDIGNVDVTSIVPGTGATNLGKAEDAAHSSGDTGVMPLAVRNDEIAALGGADGDYAPLQVNAAGALYTNDASGEAGSIFVGGTTACTPPANTKFVAIQFIEDSVFDSGNDGLISSTNQLYPSTQYTGTDIDGDAGAVVDSITFPQGMTIFGRWSGFKLASGKVIAYIGYV